jgi:hypothetical protein
MERSHADSLVKRSVIIVKKLIHLVRPSRQIITIKVREVKSDWARMHGTVVSRIITEIILLVPMILPVITAVLVKTALVLLIDMVITVILLKTMTILPIITSFRALRYLSVWQKWRRRSPITTLQRPVRNLTILGLKNGMKKVSEVIKFLFQHSVEGLLLSVNSLLVGVKIVKFLDRVLELCEMSTVGHGNREDGKFFF